MQLATESASVEPNAASSGAPSTSARGGAPPKPGASEQLLFDGSVAPVYAGAAETAMVMRRYVKSWLRDVAACKRPDPFGGDLAAARAAGELVPSVTRVRGALTAPGTQQVAYFVDFGECNSDLHTRSPHRLLVLEAGATRLDLETDPSVEGDWLQAAHDVDGDGLGSTRRSSADCTRARRAGSRGRTRRS